MADPELTTVTFAFDKAFKGMCSATSEQELRAELSNLLQHLYRLSELVRHRWKLSRKDPSLDQRVRDAAPGALGCMWIRTYDTHDIARVADMADFFSDFFTEMFGGMAWRPLGEMPFAKRDKEARCRDYELHLQNRPVLDTTRAAFDGLASILPEESRLRATSGNQK